MLTGQPKDGRQTKLNNSKPKLTQQVYELSMLFAVIYDRNGQKLYH